MRRLIMKPGRHKGTALRNSRAARWVQQPIMSEFPRTPEPDPPPESPDEVSRQLHDQIARARHTLDLFRQKLTGALAPSAREKAIAREEVQPDDDRDADSWPDRP